MKEGLKSYLFLLVIGLALAAAVAYSNRDMGYPITHLLSDGFFVAGVLLGGSGVIGFASSKGTFDMMGYGMKVTVNTVFSWMIPQDSDLGKKEDFIEFTYMIGLRTSVQQLAVGAAFGLVVILIVCGLAEWLESQY